VKRKLLNGNAAIYQVLDRKAVDLTVMQRLNGQQKLRLLIWSLLNVELWMQGSLERSTYEN
jgi:asparagine synthase (glutamine-hydrolysing)